MINFVMCMFLIAYGCVFAMVGIEFILQYCERTASEKLQSGAFWRFHVRFGGVLGIIDIVMGVISFVLGVLTGIFKPF